MTVLCDNALLTQLTEPARSRFQGAARIFSVRSEQELPLASASGSYVYFPLTALLSLVHTLSDCSSTEVMMVGQEGMISAFGNQDVNSNLYCQVVRSGQVLQLNRALFQSIADDNPALRQRLAHYHDTQIRQLCQVIACYRHHSVQQHLCRWLLAMDDRYPNQPIHITHAALAARFGVRREAVSHAASALQKDGALHYHRGQVEWIDRSKLRAYSCECYSFLG